MSNLDALLKRLEKKAAARCFSIAVDIQAEARKNLSGDVLDVQTGNLRNAVQVTPLPDGQIGYQVGVTGSPNPDNGVRASEYGTYWEFGWEDDPERGVKGQPARPWMRPAIEKAKAERR